MNALTLQPLMRCRTGSSEETTSECPWAHSGTNGKVVDGQRLIQMFLGPCDRVAEQIGTLEHGKWRSDELGLAPVPLGRYDQLAS